MSTHPWKCALVTGGGGGLGKAFAKSLIKRGKKVYIAGRTESNLSSTAKEIGAAGYFVVDLGDLGSLPAFVEKVTKEAPEVDCLLNNAGIQYIIDFANGADLKALDSEIDINVKSLVHLCALFIPHLKQKEHASIMNVSSGLSQVPIAHVPAFIQSFTLSLREQLRPAGITVLEICPPMVESNLHRSYPPGVYKAMIQSGKVAALSQDEWMAGVEKGWDEGKEEIGVGFGQLVIDKWREAFGAIHAKMAGR